MPGFTLGTVLTVIRPASTHVEVTFRAEKPLVYEPGQFISIRVDEKNIRSYSLAGKVDDSVYSMVVDVKPGGPGSKFFDGLTVGKEFSFLGPLGKFVFQPEDGASKILFLATGTGIAPLKAMIEKALLRGDMRPMVLYFGLRFYEDIFWDQFFNDLQQRYPHFKFVLCLSKPNEQWRGVCGHITDFIDIEHKDLSGSSAYLCGNGSMIKEAIEKLKTKNMTENMIYYEKFF